MPAILKSKSTPFPLLNLRWQGRFIPIFLWGSLKYRTRGLVHFGSLYSETLKSLAVADAFGSFTPTTENSPHFLSLRNGNERAGSLSDGQKINKQVETGGQAYSLRRMRLYPFPWVIGKFAPVG